MDSRSRSLLPGNGGLIAVLLAGAALLQPNCLAAEQVTVRHQEGLLHGFLALRTLEGKKVADGELTQVAQGDRVVVDLIFHFKDGSIYKETTVFTQRERFRLLSNHVLEKGPSFKQHMETSIDASTGQVTVRYTNGDGQEKVLNQKLELPPDLANGLLFTLVKNIEPSAPRTTVSMLATTPKPRLVKLAIFPEGKKDLPRGSTGQKTMVYVVKVEIGGRAGLLARLTGKQPPDTRVWIIGGKAPAFVESEGPLSAGGPVWRIQLTTPSGSP